MSGPSFIVRGRRRCLFEPARDVGCAEAQLLADLDRGRPLALTAPEVDRREGQRFYLIESQPLSELQLIADAGSQGQRISGLIGELVPEESEANDGQ